MPAPPCKRDCPDRNPTCHTSCKKYKKYQQRTAWERELRAVNRKTARNLHEDTPSLFQCSACLWECSDTVPGSSEYRFCTGCGKKIVGGVVE